MAVDQEQVRATALQYGIPSNVLSALADHPGGLDLPSSVAKAYGFEGVSDPSVKLALSARVLSDAFEKTKSWESALSVYQGHEPSDWQTRDAVGGFVDSVLSQAAVRQSGTPTGALAKSQQRLSEQGGVVKPPQTPKAAGQNDADPRQILEFAEQAKALGLDPQAIAKDFETAATLRRRLMGKPTGLEDFAEVQGMDGGAMLDYYRNQPHSTYPEITTGQFHDMQMKASLFSLHHGKRMPYDSEVARLVALNPNNNELNGYYQMSAAQQAPQQQGAAPAAQARPQVVQGGKANAPGQ